MLNNGFTSTTEPRFANAGDTCGSLDDASTQDFADRAAPSPAPDRPANRVPPAGVPSHEAAPLLDQLVAGTVGPLTRLRDAVNLTLDQVADWINQPENRGRVANLVTLLDAQTQLLLCQHRLLAVARLVEVAAGQATPEVIRRACCDLLKFRLFDPYREDKRPLSAVKRAEPAPSEEAILAALQSIGETEERVMRDMMSARLSVADHKSKTGIPD